jgi:hypothetical protein
MDYDLTPIQGCPSCQGTAGRLGCTKHSPNIYISDQPNQLQPFVQLFLRCPHCGQDMELKCFKIETIGDKKII